MKKHPYKFIKIGDIIDGRAVAQYGEYAHSVAKRQPISHQSVIDRAAAHGYKDYMELLRPRRYDIWCW